MEVLDSGSGSFEVYKSASQQSISRTTRPLSSDGKISLECLPPEVPSHRHRRDKVAFSTEDDANLSSQGSDLVENVHDNPLQKSKLIELVTEMNTTLEKLTDSLPADAENADIASTTDNDLVTNDPALLKAFSKMKKLDSRLADITKRERKVKKQRKKLEQLLEAGMEPSNALALVQEQITSDEELSPSVSPVFPTEPRECDDEDKALDKADDDDDCVDNSVNAEQKVAAKRHLPRPNGQDFIKRNIELVQDAGSVIAMTEEERRRLEFLLGDEIVEDCEVPSTEVAKIGETAFLPDENELEKLREIDSRLEAIMPAEEWQSTSSNATFSEELYRKKFQEALKSLYYEETLEDSELGEDALKEVKHFRNEQKRMREIDERLKLLEASSDDPDLPSISTDTLQELLEQCYKEQGIKCWNENEPVSPAPDTIGEDT